MVICIAIFVMIICGITAVICIPDTMRAIQNGQYKPILFGIASGGILAGAIYLIMAFIVLAAGTGVGPFLTIP